MFQEFDSLLGRAVTKPAEVLIRQSTRYQQLFNTGSANVQFRQQEDVIRLGWPADMVGVTDARGESGSAGANREKFEQLLARVKAGEIGLVAVARSDRLGRNDVDSARFLEAAAATQTLIMVGGRIYNPASDADTMMLQMMSSFAEYENRARIRWMMLTRHSKARELQYRIPLPTGLTWASPDDTEYCARLQKAGLTHWLNRLDLHRELSNLNGKPHYILPFPDAALARSVELRFQWLLETGDPREVLQRIHEHHDWPQKGRLPVTPRGPYSPTHDVVWNRCSPSDEWTQLRQWFEVPALYGTYAFRSVRLAAATPGAEPDQFRLEYENAFPSFATPADRSAVRTIFGARGRSWRGTEYGGSKPHALECLRCAEPGDRDGICGRRMTAMYQPNGRYGYYSQQCASRGHSAPHVLSGIDQEVLNIVLGAFDPEPVTRAMQHLRIDSDAALSRRRQLEGELRSLKQSIEGAAALELQYQIDNDREGCALWRAKRREFQKQYAACDQAVRIARSDEENVKNLSRADLDRILMLGQDLKSLLERARAKDPGVYRRLVRELIRAVDFRRVSGFAYELEVIFPTGVRVHRTVFTRNFVATQPSLVWAHGRLADGAEPERIAEELNWAPPRNHRVAWDAERVTTAAYAVDHGYADKPRTGKHESAAAFAHRLGVSHQAVLTAAFLDHLGPARYQNGDLHLCPTEHEIHFGIPEAARLQVAREQGWPEDDTAALSVLVAETGHSKYMAKQLARAGSGLARDLTERLYARRSDVVEGLARAIQEAIAAQAPEHADLDPSGWRPLPEGLKALPHLDRFSILRHLPHVRTPVGYKGARSVYVWIREMLPS